MAQVQHHVIASAIVFLPKDMSSAFEQSHRYEQQDVFFKLCVLFLETCIYTVYRITTMCKQKQHHFRGKFRLHDNLRQII